MSISFPPFTFKPTTAGSGHTYSECGTKDTCSSCKLFQNGRCKGCAANGGRKRCRQSSCEDHPCSRCGGREEIAEAPTICVRSPVKDLFLSKVERPEYNIKPGRVIQPKSHAVVTVIGGKSSVFSGSPEEAYIPEISCYAVALRHCWSKSGGFFSENLKDYMGLPKDKQLVLQSAMYDDVLERAADKEVHLELSERTDVDAFEPLAFSIYDDDAIYGQYLTWMRTLKGMEEGGGDFFPMPSGHHFSIDPDVKAYGPLFRQWTFNVQMTSEAGKTFVETVLRDVGRWHKLMPKNISFWFNGASSVKMVKMLKMLTRGRECYFMSAAPWLGPHKGRLFTKEGRIEPSKLPKSELVIASQRNYAWLVENA